MSRAGQVRARRDWLEIEVSKGELCCRQGGLDEEGVGGLGEARYRRLNASCG